MNKNRRDRLTRVLLKIDEIKEELEMIRDEEQEALDNLPDSFRDGEKDDKMQEVIDELEAGISDLEEISSHITIACD